MIRIPSHKAMRLRGGQIELREQPQAIRKTLEAEHQRILGIVDRLSNRNITKVYLVGCGDSYYCGMAVQYALEQWLNIPCEAIQSQEFARYYHSFTDQETLVIAASHSGTTPSTYEALLTARQAGAFAVGVTNTPHTPLMLEADAHILGQATRVGWPTQATTAQMAAIFLLGLQLAKTWHRLDDQAFNLYLAEIFAIPGLVQTTLERYDEAVKQVANTLDDQDVFFFVGGGPSLATANLAGAKVKEFSEEHAIVLEVEEYHHYDSIKKGEPLFLIAPNGQSYDRAVDTAVRAHKLRARIVALVEEGDETIAGLADHCFTLPPMRECLTPIPYVVPLQLFADHLSVLRGCLD